MEPRKNSRRRTNITRKRVNRNGKRVNPTPNYQNPTRKKRRKINKKRVAIAIVIPIFIIFLIVNANKKEKIVETSSNENTVVVNEIQEEQPKVKKEITDWRLTLANYENVLPEDFKVEVAKIDETRQFDARAIEFLNQMMNDMRKDGISNIWIQSAYRSVERQKELYDKSVKEYLSQGKTQEEAEKLTDEYINKPGSSDHNLGLAVDFNYVDNKFENLDGFKWLQENAEKYGFILRYPKDKEEITKISYESWHWRYVGEEHAKKMNELNMCLEEYVEYLQYEDTKQ